MLAMIWPSRGDGKTMYAGLRFVASSTRFVASSMICDRTIGALPAVAAQQRLNSSWKLAAWQASE
jgi:hypothetical protein